MEFWVVKFSSEGYKVFGEWFYFLNRHSWAVKKCQNLTFHVKNHLELSDFFFSLNISNIAYFMLSTFFDKFTFWNTFLRWCLIFDGSVLFLFTNYNNFLQFFWPKIYLLLYPSLGNLTTHIAMLQGCRPWGCRECHGTPQILADQLTLFQPGGTDYAHLITTGTPGFSDLPTALNNQCDKTRLEKAFSPRPDFRTSRK